MILSIFTFIHLVFSLIVAVAGIKVLSGLLAGKLLEKWTMIFLRCALVASVARLLFPLYSLQPAHWFAMSSIYVSGAAILAWCRFRLAGVWRSIFAFSITIVLCVNLVFVTTQAFTLFPALKTPAPLQSRPALLIVQLVLVIFFVAFAVVAVRRFRDGPRPGY